MNRTADSEHTVLGYLSADHDRLDALLVEVSRQMRAGDFAAASGLGAAFAAGLRRHIRLEDDVVFPMFERISGVRGGPTAVMLEEHREIERCLDGLVDAVVRRARAAFSDELLALLGVLGDHNAKEEAIIYPTTDAGLVDDERRRLVADLRAFGQASP